MCKIYGDASNDGKNGSSGSMGSQSNGGKYVMGPSVLAQTQKEPS